MFARTKFLVAMACAGLTALPAGAADGVVDEVLVTAQKRADRVLDVPMSLTVVGSETLERMQATGFTDYVGAIPGLAVVSDQPGNARLTLRGLDTGGVASTVGTYIDETPFGSSSALANGAVLAPDLDPYDVARVEILRGPQGTLYGASSLGGLIKFVTVDPSTEAFQVRAGGAAEGTDDGAQSWSIRGLVNVPLGDTAAFRVSGWKRDQGGYIDDPARDAEDINGAVTTGGRAAFLWNASDKLSFKVSAIAQDIDSSAPNTADYYLDTLEPVNGPYDQSRTFSEYSDTSYRIYDLVIDWDLGFATLLSATSYNELEQGSAVDSTVAFGVPSHIANSMEQDKFVQELRLTSPSSERLEWQVGLYYTDETADLYQNVLFGPPPGAPLGIDVGLDSTFEEFAGFGNVTWHFGPRFDIGLGLRYSENDQTATQFGSAAPGGDGSSDDGVWNYSFAPQWNVNDSTMFYGRIADGYRPGGPNVSSALGNIPPTFESDSATNYEIGYKSALVDNRLQIDLSLFYIDWEDVQLLVTDGVISGNGNGGTAESQGVEWSFSWLPAEGLSVVWTGAYTDAKLTSDAGPLTGGLDGDSLPFAPEWASSLSADYQWIVFDNAQAYVGGGLRYVGERMSAFSPTVAALTGNAQVELPDFLLLDLRAGLAFEHVAVDIYWKNVTGEDEPQTFGGVGLVPPGPDGFAGASSVLRPTTFGVAFTFDF
jgi:outer membrane receptor protein involved in Fe transport